VPARIHHISSGGHLQVKKGGSVRIECSASGNPSPNVTWTRKNNILPNGKRLTKNLPIKNLTFIIQVKKNCIRQFCPSRIWIVTRAAFTFAQPTMASASQLQVKSSCTFCVSHLRLLMEIEKVSRFRIFIPDNDVERINE